MKKPENIPLEKFLYDLPEHRVAKHPLDVRDRSELLVFRNDRISSGKFQDIGTFLDPHTRLVFNDSKVIHARMKFRKKTGSMIEIFCIEPVDPFDYQINFATKGDVIWKCIVGNSKKWKDEILQLNDDENLFSIYAERIDKLSGEELIRFRWKPSDLSFSEMLEIMGKTPIPPYLHREAEDSDHLDYQTVYSKYEGSVAAPTAGLHFTSSLLQDLGKKRIDSSYITLHVGAGTFTPVKVDNALDHRMHVERFHIGKGEIEGLLSGYTHITPVGTTSCRTLESLYWMGVKIIAGYRDTDISRLGQFEAYELPDNIGRKKSLEAILKFMEKGAQEVFFGSTGIMISPGYEFRMTDCLITNFHQPGSTLLMLIAALVGEKWKDIYEYALDHNFRFLSYGDSSLLFPH